MGISLNQFAAIIGKSHATVLLWAKNGRINASKFGGRWKLHEG